MTSTSLPAVTGFDLWGAVMAMGLVSTVYTALVSPHTHTHSPDLLLLGSAGDQMDGIYVSLLIGMYSAVLPAGGAEGRHLDRRLPDGGDVCGSAGRHRGGGQPGWRHHGGVEEGGERQPHRRPGVGGA